MLPALLRFAQRTGKSGIAPGRRPFIVEAVQGTTLYLFTKDTLDAAHHVLVFTDYEREGITGLRGSAGAADTVRVCVGGVGHVIVDDVRYTRNIDAAGCNVGSNKDPVGAVTESVECRLSPALRQIALQRCSAVPRAFELLPYALGSVFGAREDKDRLSVDMVQQFKEKSCLEVLIDRVERVTDSVCRGCVADLYRDRGVKDFLD